jgi:tetratricopeptide (TPR) repeat protein
MVSLGIDQHCVYVSPSREAVQAVLTSADCLYYSSIESLDRLDGDPYRLVAAMENGVPILGARTPIVEEFVGKHRIDFCSGSPASLLKGINKIISSKAVVNDIVSKNKKEAEKKFSAKRVTTQMLKMMSHFLKKAPTIELSAIDNQVLEVESKISSKQYLAAIDLIDSIFQVEGIPAHHTSNLYRLIGDSFTKLGDSDASKNAYLQAIEIDPYSAKAYIGLGTAAMTKMNYSAAVIHFQKAIALAPEDEMANLGLGLAFQGLEEFDEASKWVVKSLGINAENTASIFSLVKIANERHEYDEAITALETYITIHPHDHNMIFALAGLHFTDENFGKVIDLVNEIIAVDPNDSRAQSLVREATRAIQGKKEGQTSVG